MTKACNSESTTENAAPSSKEVEPQTPHHTRDFQLTPKEASAGGPSDSSVTGEEDPGAGLEFLVHKKQP